jgi:hypothetical protein
VKLRHAAPLALVFWYWLMPPNITDSRGYGHCDNAASLSASSLPRWTYFGRYDTEQECLHAMMEHALQSDNPEGIAWMMKEWNQSGRHWTPEDLRKRLWCGQCIAGDDPRLKAK